MILSAFGKNVSLYLVGTVSMRAAGFLLIPLYTYSLALKEYGILATLLVTIQGMALLMGMATDKGFLRFASECEEENLLGKLLGTTLAINAAGAFLLTALCVLCLLPLFGRILQTPAALKYVLLACVAALTQALFDRTVVYYRARHEVTKFLRATIPILALLIASNILLLRVFRQGVTGALLAQAIAYGSGWFVIFFSLARRISLGFSLDLAKKVLRFSLPLLSALTAGLALDLFAVYFLGYFAGPEQVALFSLGYKIAQIAVVVCILPFQLAYEPFVYANIGHAEIQTMISKLLTYLLFTFAILAFGLAFFTRPLLAAIAPPAYHRASEVVLMMLPGIGFLGVYYVAESLLGLSHRTGFVGGVVTFFTLLSVPLYGLLIPRWGLYGAIVVFTFARVMMAVVSMAVGKRAFPVRLEAGRLAVVAAVFVLLLVLVYSLFRSEAILYYTLVPMAAAAALFLLYAGRFADDGEKVFVRRLVETIRVRVAGQ